MSFELVIEPAAERDLLDADAYFAESGRADAFLAVLDHVFGHLTERPLMYPKIYGDVRRALVQRFSFAVFFVVEDERVFVLAIQHQRRDPASRPVR